MQIFRHLGDPAVQVRPSVVTLGNFDGIHLGHQALIERRRRRCQTAWPLLDRIDFEPHPLRVLAPDRAPKMLLTHKDKMQLFQRSAWMWSSCQHFDAAFAAIGARRFRPPYSRGSSCTQPSCGSGKIYDLAKEGKETSKISPGGARSSISALRFVEPILIDGVQSEQFPIRQLIGDGRVAEVKKMLGRYHFLSGRIVGGHERGRGLVFRPPIYRLARKYSAGRHLRDFVAPR
jgi:riboflavin kinase/FMN adenylyltransferase